MAATKYKIIPGDRFILCRFGLVHGCMVLDSGNNLAVLLENVPEHLDELESERLSVCEVGRWLSNPHDYGDPFAAKPDDVTTLYEIVHYADPSDEDEG